MSILQLYRNGNPTIQVAIDDNTIYTHEVIGLHEITADFIAQVPLDIRVDDYILFRDQRYNVNADFQCEKLSNFEYRYTIRFEHQGYWLKDKILMDEGDIEFSYFGTPEQYVQLIVDNMNTDDSGWTVGTVEAAEPKGISFFGDEQGYTCKGALMKVAEEFGLEYLFNGKAINLTQSAGVDTNLDFEYGQTRGLYSIVRGELEQPRYNRIYGFGSKKNIDHTYRDGANRLVFADKKLESTMAPGERRRETSVIFEDIYPQRTGTLTAVDGTGLILTDSTLDFDVNDYLLEGETAKVVFKSGDLSGKEYEISAYDHASKQLTILPFTEDDSYTTPNDTRKPAIGDQYTLVDIRMPQSYIDTAEALLESETQRVFNTVSRPPYEIAIDEKFMRDNAITLNAGDRVNLKDVGLGIDAVIRVFSVSFPLVNPYQVTAVISDGVVYRTEVRQTIRQEQTKEQVKVVDRTRAENYRQAVQRVRKLQGLVYDADGYFDPQNIKPGSIETIMLAVGQKSQNLALTDVVLTANPNSLEVSAGELIHFEFEIPELGYIWDIPLRLFDSLDHETAYYLYARCSKTSLTGTWELSAEPILTEQEAGYYHFWIGVLYAQNNGVRAFEFTIGMTFIVGGEVITGRLRSLDGLNFMDLSQGTFKLGNSEQSLDWGVTAAGQLTINGVLVTKMAFAENAEIINLIVKSLRTNLTGKRVEIREENNTLEFYDTAGNKVLEINDTVGSDLSGSPLAGMMVENPGNSRRSYVTATGLFSNASLMPFLTISSGLESNASVVGLLFERNTDPNGISAGVAGLDATSSGNSKSYGGYFNTALIGDLLVESLRLNVRVMTTSATLASFHAFVSCYNTSDITVSLPIDPKVGKTVHIRRINTSAVTISAWSPYFMMISDNNPIATIVIPSKGDKAELVWDGSYWLVNFVG